MNYYSDYKNLYQGYTNEEISAKELEERIQRIFQLNGITGDLIAPKAIGAIHIRDASITAASIRYAAIRSAHIAEAQIESAHIKDAQITSAHIQNAAIGTAHIQDAAITEALIAEGAVGDLHVSRLSANKLFGGTIDTTKVTIMGSAGQLQIKGNKLQIFDLKEDAQLYERIMLGVDENGDSALVLRGSDGETILLTQDGLTEAGFTDGYNKVEDNSLDPVKINIEQVVTRINEEGSTLIDGSKVSIDNQTLTARFYSIEQTVEDNVEKLLDHAAQLQLHSNEISARVTKVEFESSVAGYGGRNLAPRSKIGKWSNGWEEIDYVYTLTGTNAGLYIDASAFKEGERYTLTFKAKKISGTVTTLAGHCTSYTIHKVIRDGVLQSTNWSSGLGTNPYPDDEEVHEYEIHFTATDLSLETNGFYIQPNRSHYGLDYVMEIWDLMLVKGTVGMPFVPAQEDIQEELDTKASTENVEGQIDTAIQQIQADMTLMADEFNLTIDSKIIDMQDQITEQIQTEISAGLEGITFSLSELTTRVDEYGTTIDGLNMYFKFTTTGLNIGREESPLNINIDNEQIDFMDNGVQVAYINGQKMYITQTEITESLIVGAHKIEKYDNQRTLIRWVGEE